MTTHRATKWLGAVVAALTLTLVTSVTPASAAKGDRVDKPREDRVQIQKRDTGWDVP